MQLTIIDPVFELPYDADAMEHAALGGTEATVVRVASSLCNQIGVTVLQKGCSTWYEEQGVRYGPFDFNDPSPIDGDIVVVIQSHKILKKVRRRISGRLFLWLHCFLGKHARSFSENIISSDAEVICVSRSHRDWLDNYCLTRCGRSPPIRFIYNPVEVPMSPVDSYDPTKLMFLSSPHKGLDEVLEVFDLVIKKRPDMHLYLCNPGYMRSPKIEMPNVTILGSLSHQKAMEQLRESFCLFYPQRRFAETFGLVFAESLALRVPVLTYDVGAAAEIVGDVLPLESYPDGAVERLLRWCEIRPDVSLSAHFSPAAVRQQWLSLLAE